MPKYEAAQSQQLRDVVRQWHKAALPFIGTKGFDDTWFDFRYGWQRVRFPAGDEPMADMLASALEAELPEAARRYENPKIRLLVALCRELQRASGDRPFFISCRTAGELLGVDHMAASRWLSGLVGDSVLSVAQPGTKTRATRYRYVAAESA